MKSSKQFLKLAVDVELPVALDVFTVLDMF